MTTEARQTTGQIGKIKDIVEEYGCNPEDYSSLKVAVEIYEIAQGKRRCPISDELCAETHCRNCITWIKYSGLCRSY